MVPEPIVAALFQMASSYAQRTETKADDQLIEAIRKALEAKPAPPPSPTPPPEPEAPESDPADMEAQALKKN